MADVREMTPASTKGAAGVKGLDPVTAAGTTLALTFIKAAEDKAREDIKQGESMKGMLRKLMKLTQQEHSAFCVALGQRREAIKTEAKDAGYDDLSKFFKSGKAGGIAYSVNVTVSLWVKMSIACAGGWNPNLDQPWASLSKEATEFKIAKAAGAGKTETDTERKEREAREHKALVTGTIRAATAKLIEGEGDSAKLRPEAASALPDVVQGICNLATVEEIDAVIARLQVMRDAKVQAREEAGKVVAKAANTSDKATKAATQARSVAPGNVGHSATELVEEGKAIARGDSHKPVAHKAQSRRNRASA